jgi:hypothetical protein
VPECRAAFKNPVIAMTKRRNSDNPLVVTAEAAIGKQHGMSIDEVNRAFDSHPVASLASKDRYLTRQLARALYVLDELEVIFAQKAREGDVASGTLLVKIQSRRSDLLGLNAPNSVNVHITKGPESHRETSTEKIERVLQELCEIDQKVIDQQQQTNGAGQADDEPSKH